MSLYSQTEEYDALDKLFESPGHDVYVVYGRRRVGKTELLISSVVVSRNLLPSGSGG